MHETNSARLDLAAIVSGLFLPLLVWAGSVLVISLLGYPQVVYITPVAWLLALPLGLRVRRESHSPGHGPLVEAAVGGSFLGLCQGGLMAVILLYSPYFPGKPFFNQPYQVFLAMAGIIISIPVTSTLAIVAARRPPGRS